MALHITKKLVFQCVNTGQCRNAMTQIQVNVKRQIPDDGLMIQNIL
jgi:hypothetical protein